MQDGSGPSWAEEDGAAGSDGTLISDGGRRVTLR